MSGANEDDQNSYNPELLWSHGARCEFLSQYQEAITQWRRHFWRDTLQTRGSHVLEDSTSGRYRDTARKALVSAELRSSAVKCVVNVHMR